MATVVDNPEVNWLATIFCGDPDCPDLMIPNNRTGWDCLTCGGTLRLEVEDHPIVHSRWRFRQAGFYE